MGFEPTVPFITGHSISSFVEDVLGGFGYFLTFRANIGNIGFRLIKFYQEGNLFSNTFRYYGGKSVTTKVKH